MQLGARGVSVLVPSGDGGVAGVESNENCDIFVPTFPSNCPFVTSVGATFSYPESAASFSSGGFSNIFTQPSYQSKAVANYLSLLGTENDGKYNRSGRAFPDVSAYGSNLVIVDESQVGTLAGTPLSMTIFASVIALLNDGLISQGKPVMGFLNPILYYVSSEMAILADITTGSNPGCGTNGFPAMPGWDPVTGLGTPDFPSLQDAVGA